MIRAKLLTQGAWVATFQDYVRRDLNWQTDMYYTVTAQVQPWDQNGNEARGGSDARGDDPGIAFESAGGLRLLRFRDAVFSESNDTVAHMGLEPDIRKNISFTYYESGHMVYIDEKAHHKLHKDVGDFITNSTEQISWRFRAAAKKLKLFGDREGDVSK